MGIATRLYNLIHEEEKKKRKKKNQWTSKVGGQLVDLDHPRIKNLYNFNCTRVCTCLKDGGRESPKKVI